MFFLLNMWRRQNLKIVCDRKLLLVLAGMKLSFLFLLLVVLLMAFEGMSAGDASWLTAVTVTTVGYGDLAAKTLAGRLSTVCVGFVMIFVLGKFVNDLNDIKTAKLESQRNGTWDWGMENHLVIIGSPWSHSNETASTDYFLALIKHIRAGGGEWAEIPVLILTKCYDGRNGRPAVFPDDFRKLDTTHVTGRPADPVAIERADVYKAKYVLILADSDTDPSSDAVALDAIHRINENSVRPEDDPVQIFAECVNDANRKRMADAGCRSVLRPLRGFPAMTARSMISVGSEHIIDDICTDKGVEFTRIELDHVWNGKWNEAVVRIMNAGIGMPTSYECPEGEIHTIPVGKDIEAKAFFVMAESANREATAEKVRELFLA